MSSGDLAQVLGAAFTAIAAGAAWATVVVDGRRQRRSRRPEIVARHGVFDGVHELRFVNAGPGIAITPMCYGVVAGEEFYAHIGTGFLSPGEDVSVSLGRLRATESHLIWSCRDLDGNLHAWSHHGGSLMLSRRQLGKRESWPQPQEHFRRLYPDMPIPGSAT